MRPAIAVRAAGLGRRYGRSWALRDCTFDLPEGKVAALVGANGAGKSTLLRLLAGVLTPSEGSAEVFGAEPWLRGLSGVGFVAQEKPLYRGFTVAETLRMGRAMNPGWDQAYAAALVDRAGLGMRTRVGALSGGMRASLALAVALARRPRLLLLDEPLAEMDPIARQDAMRTLMVEVAETGLGVLMSTHVLADVDGVCDYLLLLDRGRVLLAGETDDILAEHRIVVASHRAERTDFGPHRVVRTQVSERQVTALVRRDGELVGDGWVVSEPTLDEVVVGHLLASAQSDSGGSAESGSEAAAQSGSGAAA
ncbi:ABC transporter ATP-binding protein [Solihabitans fulvus]|uniref:ABC transporter ATP-binding protein n=2 Tax=Solihabitans fulvus TaxID=1892852 RepID=A0A5B2X839_9PSEU|nr:ABC transporter ATP-binding protein [Solihabitans fulvus]